MAIRLSYAISPTEDTITSRTDGIQCPVEGCGVTLSTYALRNHLIKSHEDDSALNGKQRRNNIVLNYHCPADQCIYNESEQPVKHFKNFQELKQHYMKVHAPRQRCTKCRKPFGLERDLRRHEQICGTVFKCTECDHSYLTRHTLLTHCKRNGHAPPVSKEIGGKRAKRMSKPTADKNDLSKHNIIVVNVFPDCDGKYPVKAATDVSKVYTPILPKPLTAIVSKSSVMVCDGDTQSVVKETPLKQNMETNTAGNRASCQENRNRETTAVHFPRISKHFTSVGIQVLHEKHPVRKRPQTIHDQRNQSIETLSTGIQTSVSFQHQRQQRHLSAAGTQTSGDVILKNAMAMAEIPIHNVSIGTQASPRACKTRKKSSHTQTSEAIPPRRRRKRRTSEKASGSDAHNHISAEVDEFLKSMLVDFGSQTSLTFQDLNCSTNLGYQTAETQTAASSHLDQQSIETQTPITVFSEEPRLSADTGTNASLNFDNIRLLYTDSQTVSTSSHNVVMNTDQNIQQPSNPTLMDGMFPAVFSAANMNNNSSVPLYTVNSNSRNYLPNSKQFTVSNSELNGTRSKKTASDKSTGNFNISCASSISSQFNIDDIIQNPASIFSSKNNFTISDTRTGNEKDRLLSGFQSDVEIETDDILTMDTEVQTLASASEFDLLLESVDLQPSTPMANTQTQTADDVWNMLMTNMETQTTEDLLLPALGFSNIQTQTALELDNVNQTTVQTQTGNLVTKIPYIQSSTQTQTFLSHDLLDLNEVGDQTDGQTQTSGLHLIDLDRADTHTQTTFGDLETLLAQFEN